FDETEIGALLDQQCKFRAPADAESELRRATHHPPHPPQPPPPQPPPHELPPESDELDWRASAGCTQASSPSDSTGGPKIATASSRKLPSIVAPRRCTVVRNAACLRFILSNIRSPLAERSGNLKNLTARMPSATMRNTTRNATGRWLETPNHRRTTP